MNTKDQLELLNLLDEADKSILDMKDENRIHGHITDASAHYMINVRPRILEALKGLKITKKMRTGYGVDEDLTRQQFINRAVSLYCQEDMQNPDHFTEKFKQEIREGAAITWDKKE